ncbi:MAG TPA: 4-hydroxy-tetrahydrodipicolinate synthase [Chromatiales bacterium]|nr:4-hydroxy-tetrahydrodipicolinate synthase [Chromatiales bacterium]
MFHGSMVALVTPMHDDGSLDDVSLSNLVEFHIDNGTNAIVAVGTTGESATLDEKEHCNVIRRVVELVAGRIPVIAGTGSNCTREAIALTRSAMEAGADACLLVAPYYNKPTQEGLYQHHVAIAEAVPIPQILYNVPGRTVCDMLPHTIKRLSEISNIVGVKEATGNLQRAREILDCCGERIDLYGGDDATAMDLILEGGKGVISVTANIAPKAMRAMCDAARVGDRHVAEAINNHLMALHQDLFVEANPIPVKWLMHDMGMIPAGIRLPLTPLSENYHQTLRAAKRAADEAVI